jgi:dTDP-4-dehydrorhamnose reductase
VRLLVTGAGGLLGTAAALGQRTTHDVVAWHRSPFAASGLVTERVELTDPDSVARAWQRARPDLVLHAAAMASLEACEAAPDLARRVNVDATAELARLAAADGVAMIHVSTDAVFDGTGGPYREDDEPGPLSVYARTKLDSEKACLDAHPRALVARTNLFGWSVGGSRSIAEFFHNALAEGRPVTGFSDVEFASLYHRELAERLVDAAASGVSGLFHVVSADRMSKFEFGRRVAHTFGLDPTLVREGSVAELSGPARSRRLSLDPSAFAAATGRAMPTLDEGLARMREDEASGLLAQIRETDPTEADE